MKHFHFFRLDTINECLWREGERVPLTPKAFAMACYLVDHAGRLVTKEELMEAVWPDSYVQEENLKGYILELRRALGDQPSNPSFIETQRGRGYRFIAPVTDGAPAASAPASEPTARLLSGREKELKKLQTWFAQAERGERQVVFITGEAGIGKTALTEAFLPRTAVRVPLRTITGQCIESYREQEAYYPVLDAMGRLCRDEGGQRTIETLARLAPTWLVQFPALVTPERRETLQREILGATRARMLREFCEALEAISAETPLALVLEDLHWADHSTLDLISALAHRREPARLIVLATYRPVEAALSRHPLRQLKQELLTRRLCNELPLEHLNERAVTEYLTARFAGKTIPDGFAGLIHEQTDGRPLFMVAAVDAIEARGMLSVVSLDGAAVTLNATIDELRSVVPESLYQFIEQQIARLTDEEREVLTAASVAGTEFSAWAVAAATEREPSAVENCCESLVARQLMLRSAGLQDLPDGSTSGRYQFAHSLYREALYRRSSPVARLRLHQRQGEAMERLWGGTAEIASELARHFQEGRDWARAVRYLRLTADNDAGRYAWREAVANLESAFELAAKLPENVRVQTRIELLERLANARTTHGDKLQAIKTWERVVELAEQSGQHEAEARALLSMSHELRMLDAQRALEGCEQALEISNRIGNTLMRTEAEMKICWLRMILFGWRQELADTITRGLEWMRGAGETARYVQNAAFYVSIQGVAGDYEGVVGITAECLPISARIGDAFSFLVASALRGWALMQLGRFGPALNSLRDATAAAERNGDTFNTYFGRVFLANLHCEAFDYAGASELCQSASPVLRAVPMKFPLQRFLVVAAAAELGLGNYDRAQELLSEMRALYEGELLASAWYWKIILHGTQSELWLARGEVAAARQEADCLRELSDQNADRAWQARAWQMSARVAIAERDFARTESEISEALAIIAEIEAPLVAQRIHETAAELCDLTGRREQAEDHRRMRHETLLNLARSLDEDEPLRQSLLNSMPG